MLKLAFHCLYLTRKYNLKKIIYILAKPNRFSDGGFSDQRKSDNSENNRKKTLELFL